MSKIVSECSAQSGAESVPAEPVLKAAPDFGGVAILLVVVPVIFWATRGTSITFADTARVVLRPFLSILLGAGVALAVWPFVHLLASPLLRLFAANGMMFGVYTVLLWFVMGQKAVYLGLLKDLGVWPLAGRTRNPHRH